MIAVIRLHQNKAILGADFFPRKWLIQFKLYDFHVLRAVKNAIRVPCFHENTETAKTEPGDDRKKQRDADESEDGQDDLGQGNVRPRLIPGDLGLIADRIQDLLGYFGITRAADPGDQGTHPLPERRIGR